jgi:hypothetical protein
MEIALKWTGTLISSILSDVIKRSSADLEHDIEIIGLFARIHLLFILRRSIADAG